jgi:hypothetical protein
MRRVTTDPNDLIASDEEEGHQKPIQSKDRRIHTKIHHPYHQLLKS